EAVAFDDRDALALADRLLERLEMSTQLVLEFDNDYSTPTRCQHYVTRLPAWLERLSKALTERFALEDQLIARLHAAHAPSADVGDSFASRALS
ncbi:Rsd/AlgQ family anti-sigma factor, partial [Chromohalobacter sp. 48-RD10]